jgi:hypothetical protein
MYEGGQYRNSFLFAENVSNLVKKVDYHCHLQKKTMLIELKIAVKVPVFTGCQLI